MDKESFLQRLQSEVMIFDGAMGTMLQGLGLEGCFERHNLTHPKAVQGIHSAYGEAGAQLILTNTFGANRIKLARFGLAHETAKINQAAVRNAREVCPDRLIVGDLGPLGEPLEPLGKVTFEEAKDAYLEQVRALAGSDVIIIETVSDIVELKAALIAAREAFDGPIISSMTIQDGRTSMGTDAASYVTVADRLADIIGVNCSDGPEGMLETLNAIAPLTAKPLCVRPNAGLPNITDGKPVWNYPVDRFASYCEKFVAHGASLVGGCCGTTPEFIAAVAQKVKGRKIGKRSFDGATRLCSRTRTACVEPTLIVGERINPTNRPVFIAELKAGNVERIRDQALQQAEEGAALLDINVGAPGVDEADMMARAVMAVQRAVQLPLVLDTPSVAAMERGLAHCEGKALMNSVNGSEKSLAGMLPLAKRYGAAIIALCLDDDGIPQTKEKRLAIANRIIAAAEAMGIPRKDIIVDPLVLTIATGEKNETIVLDTLRELKRRGLHTIMGISNISHGLPNRPILNSRFFTKASKLGLDLAILDPLDNILREETTLEIPVTHRPRLEELPIERQLHDAILYGATDVIVSVIEKGLHTMTAMEINDILISALEEVGRRFNAKEYFLPQVLLSAEAMKLAFVQLKPELAKEGGTERGTVLFATVENDIHDIGKNIVIALLESHNFRVIDLGVNVKTQRIIKEAIAHKPDVIALSTLMTTTIAEMRRVVEQLRTAGIQTPVMVGGAVVTGDYATSINAVYAKDALAAVQAIIGLVK